MDLTKDTFTFFAAKAYNNPGCGGIEEFHDDLKRFKYIKKAINKYLKTGEMNERLILNHLILLHNVFERQLVPLLFFKIDREYWAVLKSFLVFLHYLPDNYEVSPGVRESDISLDQETINRLRRI